jgi:multiple sugar transport system substrate-binding protein
MKRLTILSLIIVTVLMTFAVSAQETTKITFWSNEFQPARVERQQAIINAFEAANESVEVELVVMDENLMDQLMTLNVAAGTPPDIVLHPLQLTAKWYDQGLLDAEFATEIINSLGADTFSQGALDLLATDAGNYAAVPSDGWGQMLLYRKDIFEANNLEAPTSYDAILAAAEALHDADNGFVGFLGASSASELFTWQVFEHVALANGATFVDAEGNITFDTPEMIEALEFYNELMTNYGPRESDYYWLQTRAEYLAGNGAMTIWSPFILDEMAGLRDSVLPSCAECEEDPGFIARNTGVVSAFSGFSSDSPAAWGSVNSLGIAPGALPEAQAFVEFWMSEAYLDGLAIAAEGKFPMRRGTAEEPNAFVEGWGNLDVGVDRRAPLSEFYDAETLNTIVSGSEGYSRMGYDVGQALIASAVSTQFFIQEAIVEMLNGDITPEEAAIAMQEAAEELQAELSEE